MGDRPTAAIGATPRRNAPCEALRPAMQVEVIALSADALPAASSRDIEDALLPLVRLRSQGKRVVLVTWEELDPVLDALPNIPAFDAIIAEGGALLYLADPPVEHPLVEPLAPEVFPILEGLGLRRLEVGRLSVSGVLDDPQSLEAVVEEVRRLGLAASFDIATQRLSIASPQCCPGRALEALLGRFRATAALGVVRGSHALRLFSACVVRVATADASPWTRRAADELIDAAGAGATLDLVRLVEVLDRPHADPPCAGEAPPPRSTRRSCAPG